MAAEGERSRISPIRPKEEEPREGCEESRSRSASSSSRLRVKRWPRNAMINDNSSGSIWDETIHSVEKLAGKR